MMNIAVVYDQGAVGAHFGHAKQMKLYHLAPTGVILESHVLDTNVTGHVAMCNFLREHQVQTLICQNIGKESLQHPAAGVQHRSVRRHIRRCRPGCSAAERRKAERLPD